MVRCLLFVFPLLLVACGEPVPETVGELCQPVVEIVCDKCASDAEQGACVADVTEACCDGDCAARFFTRRIKSRKAWNECLDAYEASTCDALLQADAEPASCQTMWEVVD